MSLSSSGIAEVSHVYRRMPGRATVGGALYLNSAVTDVTEPKVAASTALHDAKHAACDRI
jgi:hypothetical protein